MTFLSQLTRRASAEWSLLSAEIRLSRPGDAMLQVSTIAVGFVATAYLLGDIWFVLGGNLSRPASLGILVLAACAAIAAGSIWGRRTLALTALAVALVYAAAVLAAQQLIDITYDGQDYHFTAMWALVNGWNPYHNHFSSFIAPGSDEEMWAWHFPKAHWLFGALQTSAGLSYEAAKTETILLAVATIGAACGVGRRFGIAPLPALGLAILAALNPIVLQESFSRMNDGMMAGFVLCFLAFGSLWVIRGERRAMLVAMMVLAVALNTKQSAIVILGILCAWFCLLTLVRLGGRAALGRGALMLATALVALFVLGADPYLRNWVKNGNPVYPMRGAPQIMIDDEFRPAALAQHSDPVRLAMSLAGRTSYVGPTPKLPFAVYREELELAGDPEVFLAGFGPWFSGALLLGAVAGLFVASRRPGTQSVTCGLALTALVVAASSFSMPESWAVRYVPQLWLVPLLFAAAALSLPLPRGRARWLAAACCIALLGDSAMVAGSVAVRQGRASAAIAEQIARLRHVRETLSADVGASPARLSLLEQRGLRVVLRTGPDPRCRDTEPMRNAYDYEAGAARPATVCRMALP